VRRQKLIGLVLTISLLSFCTPTGAAQSPTSLPESQLINLEEAEILIYLLPQARELRRQGMDIGWELQTSTKFNQEDFFVFLVANTKRSYANGSVSVGYFAVNKHNAEIWSLDINRFVSSQGIRGVQKIIRSAHHIDEAVIRRYHSRRPDILTDTEQ